MGHTGEKAIHIPENSADLAEFMGIMLGDGSSYFCKKSHNYQVRIVGHSEETEYYVHFIVPLCERLFGFRPRICHLKRHQAIMLAMDRKQLMVFLEKMGFPPGNNS